MAENFKSFEHLDVSLDNLHVVVGANASGKSNFARVFQFLSNVLNHDVENAVALEGGFRHLRSHRARESDQLVVEVTFQNDIPFPLLTLDSTDVRLRQTRYRVAVEMKDRSSNLLVNDSLETDVSVVDGSGRKHSGVVKLYRGGEDSGVLRIEWPLGLEHLLDREAINKLIQSLRLNPNQSLLSTPAGRAMFEGCRSILEFLAIFRIDTAKLKEAVPMMAERNLEPNGGNLALVVQRLLSNDESRRFLTNIVRDLMPFVSNLGAEPFAEQYLTLKVMEAYSSSEWLPAFLLSDGTLSLLALVVLLYFDERPFVVVEEPERFVHPQLLPRLMSMFREASTAKQILMTTHSPEIVRNSALPELLLIARGRDGLSQIQRPAESEAVRSFVRDEIGLSELYLENMLEA